MLITLLNQFFCGQSFIYNHADVTLIFLLEPVNFHAESLNVFFNASSLIEQFFILEGAAKFFGTQFFLGYGFEIQALVYSRFYTIMGWDHVV